MDNDLEFIKKYSKISIRRICKDNNVNPSNVWAGRASHENIHKVRKGIEREIWRLYDEEYQKS